MIILKKIVSYFNFALFHWRKFLDFAYTRYLRSMLKNRDFSIISNNCWAGGVYQDLGIPYKTPTVGLFFFSDCYLSFLLNLKNNLNKEIAFTQISKYDKGNYLKKSLNYPIGILDNGIEIHFLHYKSEAEAAEKWEKRKRRINFDNLFISFSDTEGITTDELIAFNGLPYKKVFFSSQRIVNIDSLVWLKKFEHKKTIGDIYTNRWDYRKYFNVVKWLNS